MKPLVKFLKRPPVYYAIFLAILFPILRAINLIAVDELGFRIFHPFAFGILIGYLGGRHLEKLKELHKEKEVHQEEMIALMQKKSDLESENRARFAFIANSSHELRTPLNAVIGFSDLLIDEFKSDKEKNNDKIKDLERINKAGTYLLSLINDLLDLSKLNAGKMEFLKEEIHVDLLIHDLVAISEPLVNKKNNELISENIDVHNIFADEMKLKQSLLNLISNAAKFTENGTIKIEAKATGDFISISVTDTGIGMNEEQKSAVFEEFKQADSSTAKNYGGTGLGLPLTKQFIELMGGSIQVSSKPGKGSTFSVLLPVSQ